MSVHAYPVHLERVEESRTHSGNPMGEIVNSPYPADQEALESPLAAIVNGRVPLPVDQVPAALESPLSALINGRADPIRGDQVATEPSPMARWVNH